MSITRRSFVKAGVAVGVGGATQVGIPSLATEDAVASGRPELKVAWEDFCERLKQAGDVIFDDAAPETPLERAEGIRYLSRLIKLGLNLSLEYNDPMFPELVRYFGPTLKSGGDNPDAIYLGSRINGAETYRVSGKRGNAGYLVFTILKPTEGVEGGHAFYGTPLARLQGSALQSEADGSFELILSPDEHSGNWLQTAPETSWFTIRQFFGDWRAEEPMSVTIERVGGEGPPPGLNEERMLRALAEAGSFVGGSAAFWVRFIERYRPETNRFVPHRVSGLDGAPGGVVHHCFWWVEADEVLLIQVQPVECSFWNFELNNYWMNSVDYRYHVSSINGTQAIPEEDGSVRIAIAHEDPGIPNWLDTAGFNVGLLNNRWMQAESSPLPDTRLLKLAALPDALPKDARRISPQGRIEQLRQRRLGIDRRFPP